MKNVTDNFKIDLRTYGRQFDAKIFLNNKLINTDTINYLKPSFNTKLFKSIMHQIEIDSNVFIEKDTKIDIELGVKVNEKNYEYINFKTYYVQSCERQEDTNSYRILAYCKMRDSMIDYDLLLGERISVRNYLIKICERLGWNTKNIPATFINSDKLVDPILHTGIKYTFRDVLDEIATISCSFILFENDELYLKYVTETNETIDDTYLDEDNITISEEYFINSLVFARAEESDNIYRKNEQSIYENGLHEFRVSDNQLLSTNDRVDYIDEMFNYLNTFRFYVFDVQSKGILFFEPCDRLTLNLNDTSYSVILLNDEIEIEDGIKETLYADKPEETETDYKYADTTDRRINQTYRIVDKQNQKIESVANQIGDRSEKTTTLTQDIDSINSRVEDIEDLTVSISGVGSLVLENCIKSNILNLTLKGNIELIYPSNTLYPSESLFPKDTYLIIQKTIDEQLVIQKIHLPIKHLYYYSSTVYDEFIVEYNSCKIIHRVELDSKGNKIPLYNPYTEELGELIIDLSPGINTIMLESFPNILFEAKYIEKNDFTDAVATKVEMSSSINQTAQEISTEVRKKVDENEIISKINQSAEEIQINADKISLERKRNRYD